MLLPHTQGYHFTFISARHIIPSFLQSFSLYLKTQDPANLGTKNTGPTITYVLEMDRGCTNM